MKHLRTTTDTRGFTLIEALVAILVFTSALIIFGTILAHALSSITNARAELQAYLFAEEGIEAVHQIRDTNGNTASGNWLAGLDPNCIAPNMCMLAAVYPAISLAQCPISGCAAIDDAGDYFDQSNLGTPTQFVRSITINRPLGTPNEATVTATVRWIDTAGRARTTTVNALVQDWR